MGGDTYNEIPPQVPQGLLDLSWSNGFKNDVWSMKGTDWQVSLQLYVIVLEKLTYMMLRSVVIIVCGMIYMAEKYLKYNHN